MSYRFNNLYWYKVNFDLLWKQFPNTKFDYTNCKWLKIPNYPLPDNWMQDTSDLLIVLPGINGDIALSKPDNFYVELGLRTIRNIIPDHIYENHSFNDLYHKNWARYSFHLKKWNPSPDGYSGDTLITIIRSIFIGLFLLADETNK